MSENGFKLTILIPGWNAEQYIENCINSILKNYYKNYNIIIIAGGSDKSYQIALDYQNKYPNKIKALEQKIPHKNKALNLALSDVDGDIIIITDIDCIYPKHWLGRINEIFQDKKINVITGLYLPYQEQKNSLAEVNRIRHGGDLIKHKHSGVIPGRKLWGGNAAFRKKVFFEKIGKFDEIAYTGDDKILGMQFNEKGESLYYFKDIYIYTECYSNNLKKYTKRRIRWARDLFITGQKINTFKVLILFGIGLFKLFYPIATIIVALLFFNVSYIWLFLLPWIIVFLYFLIVQYFLLKRTSDKINSELKTNFNHKKAFKIMPLLFFIFGIINVISFSKINPKKRKWYH